jgi:hypothetical protein
MALTYAIYQCDTVPAQIMLDNGADAFAVDSDGNGCLNILAFCIYRSASVRSLFARLVARGLDVNASNNCGESSIFNLNRHIPSRGVFKLPKDECISADEALAFLEDLGVDLFATDRQGKELLHIVSKAMVEVDVNSQQFAVFAEQKKEETSTARFQALLSKGLDQMMEDGKKRTALKVAAPCGKECVLRLYEKESGSE